VAALGDQMARHGESHDAETEKCDFCHSVNSLNCWDFDRISEWKDGNSYAIAVPGRKGVDGAGDARMKAAKSRGQM